MGQNFEMPNKFRKQFSNIIPVILCCVLLVWSSGEAVIPSSALQIFETSTPPSPEASLTPATTLLTDAPILPETATSTGVGIVPVSTSRPLPAIFASGAYAANELIVRFKPSTRETRIKECFQDIDVQVLSEIEELNTLVLGIPSGNLADAYSHILACAGVLYVEPNFLLQAADTIPNDPSWGLQYGLVNIRAPQGWDLTTGSAAVTIAIVDTGVDYGHADLAGKLVGGYDFVNNDADPQDDNGHGTHVAGIAAASSNNGTGVAGVSWGAHIMPVKVLNAAGGGSYANTALGVIWAADHGAQVINLSLGGTGPSSVLEDAINYAHSKGTVVVAAAGNSGSNFVLYPARYPNVIAVAKTNSANNWDGSNYGPEVDLAAPGTLIYSTIVGGYDYKSGSSMSTGFVSGLAAVLEGISGNVSPDTIESQMESTALDIEFAGWDDYTGAGLIQMDAAIQSALSLNPPPKKGDSTLSGGGYLPILVTPSFTPSPTWTISPATSTYTVTTLPGIDTTPTIPKPGTSTNTAVQGGNEVEAQGDSSAHPNYVLPCTGVFLILLGILLAWLFRRRRRN